MPTPSKRLLCLMGLAMIVPLSSAFAQSYSPVEPKTTELPPSVAGDSGGASPSDTAGASAAPSPSSPNVSAGSPQIQAKPDIQLQPKVLYRVPVRARL